MKYLRYVHTLGRTLQKSLSNSGVANILLFFHPRLVGMPTPIKEYQVSIENL